MISQRNSSFRLYFGIFLFAASMLGATAVHAADGPQLTKDEALKLQEQFQRAVVAADGATLDKLMANDCIFIHGNGMMQDKAAFAEALTNGSMKVTEFKSTSPVVISFSGGAIVTSLADWGMLPPRGAMNAKPMVLHMRISQVWVHTVSGWQMILEQDTGLPQPSGLRPVESHPAPPGAPKP
jgi:hypothetical protein